MLKHVQYQYVSNAPLLARDEAAEAAAAAEKAAAEKAAAEKAAAEAAEAAKKKTAPSDAEAALLKEVMQKKEEAKKAKDEAAALAAKLKEFEGIDPVAIRKLVEEQKAAEEKALEAKGEWETLKKQMNEQQAQQLAAKDAELAAAKEALANLNRQIADATIGNSFGNSQYIRDELVLTPVKARAVFGSHFEIQDGNVVAYDKPAGVKSRAMLVDVKGDPLGFEEAIRKIVEADSEQDHLLKSKMKPGAASSTTGGKTVPETKVELTGSARIAAALSAAKK